MKSCKQIFVLAHANLSGLMIRVTDFTVLLHFVITDDANHRFLS